MKSSSHPSKTFWFLSRRRNVIAIVVVLLLLLLILLLLLLILPQSVFLPRQQPAATTVTVDTSQRIGTIAQDYVGLSTEEGLICTLIQAEAAHPELDAFFNNLSPMVLRIAANTSDRTTWSPTGGGCSGSGLNLTMSQSIIDSVFAIARKTNMKVIWGVNLKANQPTSIAQEVAYVVQAGGSNLLAIEIGNEPDLYHVAYSRYIARWESYYTAIKQLSPNAPIEGPDTAFDITCATCTNTSFLGQFLRDEGSKVQFATSHSYFSNRLNASIQHLLDPAVMKTKVITDMGYDVAAAKAAHVSIIEDETNSDTVGAPGIGSAFASSLWGLDYLLTAAETGISGIDFYGNHFPGSIGDNEPIAMNSSGEIQAQPLYYAMLLFHNLAQGGTLVKTTTSSPINLTSHAVVASNGKLQIFLINKDQTNDTTAKVTVPAGYTSGTVIRLQAPSVTSQSVTLGGSSIAANGTMSPATVENVSVGNNTFTIAVPHASAVTITLSSTSTHISSAPSILSFSPSTQISAIGQPFTTTISLSPCSKQGSVVNLQITCDPARITKSGAGDLPPYLWRRKSSSILERKDKVST